MALDRKMIFFKKISRRGAEDAKAQRTRRRGRKG